MVSASTPVSDDEDVGGRGRGRCDAERRHGPRRVAARPPGVRAVVLPVPAGPTTSTRSASPAKGPASGGAPSTPAPRTAARKSKQKLEDLDAEKSGKGAVEKSIDTGRLAFLDSLSRNRKDRLWTTQRVAGRVLHFVGGIWVDGRYTREDEKKLEKIEAFSDAYFALLRAKPELGKLFAFSTSIVTLVGDRAIQIVPAKD